MQQIKNIRYWFRISIPFFLTMLGFLPGAHVFSQPAETVSIARSGVSAIPYQDEPGSHHSLDTTAVLLGANMDLFAVSRDFGEAGERRSLTVREVEVSLEVQVKPWLYGMIFMSRPEGESFGIEEAAVIADLPWGLRLKAGQYRVEFGFNTIHEPERPQVSLPLPIEEFLGETQLREAAVTVGRMFRLGGRSRAGISAAILNSDNEVAFNAAQSKDKAYSGKLYYGYRSKTAAYQFGLSLLTGKNDEKGVQRTDMQAFDFRILLDPDYARGFDYPSRFYLMGEALFNRRQMRPAITGRAFGFWAVADYQFRPTHHFGAGVEYAEGLLDTDRKSRAYSAHYSWYYSPHGRLQLQARRLDIDDGDSGLELQLQWNIVLGPHTETPLLDILGRDEHLR